MQPFSRASRQTAVVSRATITHTSSVSHICRGDFLVSSHLTVVAGDYLIPFNTYNERLSPIWISNFQDGPLISPLGVFSIGEGLGGMLRGNAIRRNKYSIDYAYFYSTRTKK